MPSEPIYVVMVADRHTDTEAHLFSDREVALQFAREETHRITHGRFEVVTKLPAGWLFLACHEVESDSVWVVEKRIDAEVP